MIIVFGSINMDLVATVKSIVRPGETVLARDYRTFFGGKGANQAIAAGRAAPNGMKVTFAGAVGQDEYGKLCTANLNENGVSAQVSTVLGSPTGVAFISVDDSGENAITVVSGANSRISARQVSDDMLSLSKVVVLQMESPFAQSSDVAARARQRGCRVLWNLAPVGPELDIDSLKLLLARTDFFVVNESEAHQAAVLLKQESADSRETARMIAETYNLVCVVTLGGDGIWAAVPGGTSIEMRPPPTEVIDTTGAGDTFCGVLASGIAEGLHLEQCLERAVAAASLSCTSLGAQSSMPHRVSIDAAAAAARVSR
ncbi:MAG TPA: ribokinase [Steroidobacteraceae bacterium]|nr:ribokinase [Steroidobacteraceae bacterium]